MTGPVPLHPEAVPNDARRLRWVIPAATLGVVGPVAQPPRELALLVEDGTVVSVGVEPTAVLVELGAGRSWRAEGARVRAALQAALSRPQDWHRETAQNPDDILRFATDEVLAGEVGEYIRSHGGAVSVLSVADGVVRVSLSGACSHCPASDRTLTGRIETAIRARCPWLAGLEPDSGSAGPVRRWLLPLAPVRSR